ncbi:hypothetical protein ACQKF2_08540 [Pseudomonas hunanensis]|uniref:HORMA-1 domain-containing protein n=1 Tax=Pseudomonas hunanensis TaxID=1247546 RepID=UPI003D059F9D
MSSYSLTIAETQTFTVTHARHLAAKVATDLRRMQRFYGSPSDKKIDEFEAELVLMLKAGYLHEVTYGFKRNNEWIEPTLRYTASDLAETAGDDDPGRVRPGRDTSGSSFYSFLSYSDKYFSASSADRQAALKDLPFDRTTATSPGISGYLETDKSYSAGGRALSRASVRSF